MALASNMLQIKPMHTAGGAAVRYVPLVLLTRAMAFLRFLLVAWLLGDLSPGKSEYGKYQLALEIINWGVPIILFGLADVAERYASRFEREGALAPFFWRHAKRLSLVAAAVSLTAIAGAPLLGDLAFRGQPRNYHAALIVVAAFNMGVLAFYQWTAAALRGVRAYGAAAAIEVIAATLLLGLSSLAALRESALWLLLAYGLSNLLPMCYYLFALQRHARAEDARERVKATLPTPRLDRFARWSLVRLLLMMTFGLISIGAVGWMSTTDSAWENAAEYAMPYRIAQLLQYLAVTLWTSNYGIAARAWSHGSQRRAMVTLLRAGKLGGVLLLAAAGCAIMGGGIVEALVRPSYRAAIHDMLPPLLAMFIWYGMLALLSMVGDLEERPQRGASLWASAVIVQVAVLLAQRGTDTPQHVALLASCCGLGFATLILGPALVWRPLRLGATAVPLGIVLLCPLAFFTPAWLVREAAPLAIVLGVGFLWVTGILVRPRDRRAIRRHLARRGK